MHLATADVLLLSALVFLVAVLYSSVGHGGASGYLAILAMFAVPPDQMAATALILNIVVSGLASFAFIRAGYLPLRLFWLFALMSVPFAFVGGMLKISDHLYYLLLAVALLAAAVRLMVSFVSTANHGETRPCKSAVALPVGAGIGLLSGMVGVGGGIFLSPLLLFAKWADVKQTAAISALFILVNSLAGLGGRMIGGRLDAMSAVLPLVAAVVGGSIGSYCGARRMSGLSLRRTLAVVLIIAAIKLAIAAF